MTSRFNLQHQKLPVWRDVSICNIKNYRYDEPFQFATLKTTGMTSRCNLQHQKVPVRRADAIWNTKKYRYDETKFFAGKKYRYDEVKNFAGKKYLMKEWLTHSTGAHPGRVILRPCSYPKENKRKQKAAALLVDLAVLL